MSVETRDPRTLIAELVAASEHVDAGALPYVGPEIAARDLIELATRAGLPGGEMTSHSPHEARVCWHWPTATFRRIVIITTDAHETELRTLGFEDQDTPWPEELFERTVSTVPGAVRALLDLDAEWEQYTD